MFVASKIDKAALIQGFDKKELRHEIDTEGIEWYTATRQSTGSTVENTQSYNVSIFGKTVDFDSLGLDLGYYSSTPIAIFATLEDADKWLESSDDHDAYFVAEVPDISNDEAAVPNLPA